MYQGEEQRKFAKVIQQSIDENGIFFGRFDNNLSINTLVYDVKFPDGAVNQYAVNVIAMNIVSQVNSDIHNSKTLNGIVYYKQYLYDVSKDDAFITTNRGFIDIGQKKKYGNCSHPMEEWNNNLDAPQDYE